MKSYTGLHGERITANDEYGQQFIDAYARHAAAGAENSKQALGMLARIVEAAGGEVRVVMRGLGTLSGKPLTLIVSEDTASMDLVFSVCRE